MFKRVFVLLVVLCAAAGTALPGAAQEIDLAGGGGANNVVLVNNTNDGSTATRAGLQVAFVGGPTVESANIAAATGFACIGCRTVAVAMQAVVITGDASVVAPGNAAVATNGGCNFCTTAAFAFQYVLSVHGPLYLSPEGRAQVQALREELSATAASDLSPPEMKVALQQTYEKFKAVVNAELVRVGQTPAGSDAVDVQTAQTP
jgi:hypothetical protein